MPQLVFRYANPGLNDHLSSLFFREAIRRGVLLHPSHNWFLSGCHTPGDLERVVQVADAAFAVMRHAAEPFERPVAAAIAVDTCGQPAAARKPPYRVAFVGCGARAAMHAAAYGYLSHARLIACADARPETAQAFATRFDVPHHYGNVDDMLAAERPDIVHVITPPFGRGALLALVANHQVPLVIVEKPIALDVTDYHATCELAAGSATRFVANHQLRYHATLLPLIEMVAAGRIGSVRLIDASCRLSLFEQGPHLVDLILAFAQESPVVSAFGTVRLDAAADPTSPLGQTSLSELRLLNGLRAILTCGANAPATSADRREYRHKRVSVFGTRGFVHWNMHQWECFSEADGYAAGPVDYAIDDVRAQAALVRDALDTFDVNQPQHPTAFASALGVNATLLACYASALSGDAVRIPIDTDGDLLPRLQRSSLVRRLLC